MAARGLLIDLGMVRMGPLAVYTVSVLVMAVMAVLYAINRMRLPSRQTVTWWGIAFVSGVICASAYFIGQRTDDVWWTVSAGNATMVLTVAAAWLGCRAFNGRRMRVAVGAVLLLAVVVAVASALPSDYGSKYAGALEKTAALIAFSALALAECLRRPLRSFGGAAVIAVVFGLHIAFLVPRGIVFAVAGPSDPLFTTWFNTLITTVLNIVFTVVVEAAILWIQARGRPGRPRDRADGAAVRNADPLRGTLVVGEVDVLAILRRAYGGDLAAALTQDLEDALRAAARDAGSAGPSADAAEVAVSSAVRLRSGRVGVVLATTDRGEVLRFVRAVREEFGRRAALPESRPTVSFAVVSEAADGAATVGAAAAEAARRLDRPGRDEIETVEGSLSGREP